MISQRSRTTTHLFEQSVIIEVFCVIVVSHFYSAVWKNREMKTSSEKISLTLATVLINTRGPSEKSIPCQFPSINSSAATHTLKRQQWYVLSGNESNNLYLTSLLVYLSQGEMNCAVLHSIWWRPLKSSLKDHNTDALLWEDDWPLWLCP
jgi:hypothetical protein